MIYTFSKFNYGLRADNLSRVINFTEGGPELTATIETGSYTLGEYVSAIASALNTAGALDYTVTLNRSTNVVTISAPSNFNLLLDTGSNVSSSFASLLGFTQTTDLTGTNTYTGASPAGYQYSPQFMLQSYVSPDTFQQSVDAVVNKTASGRVEVVRFGIENFIEMDIKFITNKLMDNILIKNNPTGVEDAIAFLSDITEKSRFEFVPDVSTPSVFEKVLLESTPQSQNGTGFKLKELFSQNLPDFYETGVIKLRVIS